MNIGSLVSDVPVVPYADEAVYIPSTLWTITSFGVASEILSTYGTFNGEFKISSVIPGCVLSPM